MIRDASRAWGAPNAVAWLMDAFDAMRRNEPGAPRVRVHDLSLPNGGFMDGHKSHQSGRDADLSYYQRGVRGLCAARTVTPATLDARRQWRLLEHWLARDEVEFVFVDYRLQGPLYEAARSAGATSAELRRWFQWPRGQDVPIGIVRHEDGHANHVHVRFRCAHREKACEPTPTRRLTQATNGALQPLLELLEDESEDGLLELLR